MQEIVRVVTKEQIQTLANLAKLIWTSHYTPIIGKNQVDYMVEKYQSVKAILEQIENENYLYFLLYQNREPAGYFSFKLDENEVFLSKLYVKAELRKKGLGRKAMTFIQNITAENCLKNIRLTVNKNNKDSISAYLKLGFENVGPLVTDIGNGFVMDDYVLRKTLS